MKAGDMYPLLTRAQADSEIMVVREVHKGAVIQAWGWGFIWGVGVGVLIASGLIIAFLYALLQVY